MPAAADDKSAVVSWETLAQVSVTRQKDRYVPEFSKQILALDKREVKLKGFMMPLEPGLAQTHFLLSAQPPDCAVLHAGHRRAVRRGAGEGAGEGSKRCDRRFRNVLAGAGRLRRLLYRLTEAVVVNK
jgi:hypothetical protein